MHALPAGFTLEKNADSIAIECITPQDFSDWLNTQSSFIQSWIKQSGLKAKHGEWILIPAEKPVCQVVIILDVNHSIFEIGKLPFQLAEGTYFFNNISEELYPQAILAWGLGAYQFTYYKTPARGPACLYLEKAKINKYADVIPLIQAIYSARDKINLPAEECHPTYLSHCMQDIAKQYQNTEFSEIVGEELLKQGFNLIHAAGRASHYEPRLLELKYGNSNHKKLTLIGKGVCFDSGGLDIKPANYMLLMKKDMGGAAIVLALAELIIKLQLPIYLQVLIPAVENSIDARAFRPGDVIRSRAGLTVEIGNTDAEGRLILADAIHYAICDKQMPDCLIDIATLTGAARIALGTDLPALFVNNDNLAKQLLESGEKANDLMWRLPLHSPYKELNHSTIADINNSSAESYGGAITAALFLQAFIPETLPWAHIDVMAWNVKTKPSRPQGGEAMTLRAIYYFIKHFFIS